MWDEYEPETTLSCLDLWTFEESKTFLGAQWVSISICAVVYFQIKRERCCDWGGAGFYCCNREALYCNRSSTGCKLLFLCYCSIILQGWTEGNQEQASAVGPEVGQGHWQLQQNEELMCFALVILRRINPSDLVGPFCCNKRTNSWSRTSNCNKAIAHVFSLQEREKEIIFFLCLFIYLFSFIVLILNNVTFILYFFLLWQFVSKRGRKICIF